MPDNIFIYILGALIIILLIIVLIVRSKSHQAENSINQIKSEQKSIKDRISASEKKNETITTRIEEIENAQMQADIDIRKLDESLSNHHQRVAHNINELYKQDKTHEERLAAITYEAIPALNESLSSVVKSVNNISVEVASIKKRMANNEESFNKLSQSVIQEINALKQQSISISNDILKISNAVITLQKAVDNYLTIKADSERLNSLSASPITQPETSSKSKNEEEVNTEKLIVFEQLENTNDNYLITGKGGTGKSYLLSYYRKHTKKSVICMAPTGISAVNIDGSTIHSVFGFDNISNIKGDSLKVSGNLKTLLKKVDTLVIDEISMVRADAFNNINKLMQMANENDQPFGGKQILLFGDLFQLPPVAKDDESKAVNDLYGGLFFFFAPAFKSGNFHFIELQELFRFEQKTEGQQRFIKILDKAREGTINEEDIAFLNNRYVKSQDLNRTVIRLFTHNKAVANTNNKRLLEIQEKEYVFNAITNYKGIIDDSFKDSFPCTFELRLKVGAVVMMISNDTEYNRWVNGTRGIISYLSNDMVKVTINRNEYEINKKTFTKKKCTYDIKTKKIQYETIASVTQYPIVLAYAITVHKSQGQTYPELACTISNSFASGQAYVALSRCRDYEHLYLLRKITQDNFIVDESVKRFYLNQKSKSE